ncbi:hypothetical protein AB4Y42_40835 [Paraburkholderia sp. EG286B]|uniref:hypothetical protein n=1 Tax=Paraburkholderia sp. EG286B TaxID=3237011 RepID=UPI0034D21A09
MKRLPAVCPRVPGKIVTKQLRSYQAEITEPTNASHACVRASARVNDRAEYSHRAHAERGRRMPGIRVAYPTQATLYSFGPARSTLRSGYISYGFHAIASNARCSLLRNIASPNSSKLRLPHSERQLARAGIALSSLT